MPGNVECCGKPGGGFGGAVFEEWAEFGPPCGALEKECLAGGDASKWCGQGELDDVGDASDVVQWWQHGATVKGWWFVLRVGVMRARSVNRRRLAGCVLSLFGQLVWRQLFVIVGKMGAF